MRNRVNLSLSLSNELRVPWLDEALREKIHRLCASLDESDGNVSMVVVDDAFIRRLNREYRGIDAPTDVISFSYIDDDVSAPDDDIVGEVFVSNETLEKEARQLGVSPDQLFLRIGLHGLLHVLGRDHQSEEEATSMEHEERRLLRTVLSTETVEALF